MQNLELNLDAHFQKFDAVKPSRFLYPWRISSHGAIRSSLQ